MKKNLTAIVLQFTPSSLKNITYRNHSFFFRYLRETTWFDKHIQKRDKTATVNNKNFKARRKLHTVYTYSSWCGAPALMMMNAFFRFFFIRRRFRVCMCMWFMRYLHVCWCTLFKHSRHSKISKQKKFFFWEEQIAANAANESGKKKERPTY